MKEKSQTFVWNGTTPLKVAVMVDVDGTLADVYREGRRRLRPGTLPALRALAEVAPVILWSSAGPDNGMRLVAEYYELDPYVCHFASKIGFPLELIEHPYCIDDNDAEDVVLQCKRVIVETFEGEDDPGPIKEAARLIIEDIRELLDTDV
jgi:hypothetical protein